MRKKVKLRDAAFISEQDLDDIFKEIESRADTSSNNIYVYSYLPQIRKSVPIQNRRPTRHRVSPKPTKGRARIKGTRRAKTKGGIATSSRKWAVRVEGTLKPVHKIFDSQEEASKYAKKLRDSGRGKRIVVE